MTQIILQNIDQFSQLLELNTVTGEKKRFQRDPGSQPRIEGHFAELEGSLILFYRDDDILHFESNGINLALEDTAESSWNASKSENQLVLSNYGLELITVKYDPRKLEQPIPGDTTGFVEDEQFDLCLFVHNVLNDPERKASIYRNF